MSEINTEHLQKCIDTLEKSCQMLKNEEKGSVAYEMYRNSLVKSFEMTLEQGGKLLMDDFLADAKRLKEMIDHA